ncbi:UPF0462 protein C4orf33 homolog isoform X3 [Bubalus kerabau]|uniref:UPF0462 protein C4orf33 homolog isoform X3 n=1 Tax=Bubalus carabanensis TaxID=3119969 RepID=UPI00244E624B|nr:UPF0462 protein C4orf33 homolog isoform X3 [Bubalus carabanensis]
MDFKIEHTWDGFPVKHEPVFVRLNPGDRGVMMEVSAPFFNDPPAPLGEPGKPFNQLWDYEVVEAFFLNDITEQYLEVELCPHGQHLVLLLSGRRNVWKQGLDLSFRVSRGETKWEGYWMLTLGKSVIMLSASAEGFPSELSSTAASIVWITSSLSVLTCCLEKSGTNQNQTCG